MSQNEKNVYHKPNPTAHQNSLDAPIPAEIYPVIDNDLARDNLENDIPDADKNPV